MDPIRDYFVKILFGLAVVANMGVFFSNMGSFLFVDISNVAVDILTISLDDSLLSLNVNNTSMYLYIALWLWYLQ